EPEEDAQDRDVGRDGRGDDAQDEDVVGVDDPDDHDPDDHQEEERPREAGAEGHHTGRRRLVPAAAPAPRPPRDRARSRRRRRHALAALPGRRHLGSPPSSTAKIRSRRLVGGSIRRPSYPNRSAYQDRRERKGTWHRWSSTFRSALRTSSTRL